MRKRRRRVPHRTQRAEFPRGPECHRRASRHRHHPQTSIHRAQTQHPNQTKRPSRQTRRGQVPARIRTCVGQYSRSLQHVWYPGRTGRNADIAFRSSLTRSGRSFDYGVGAAKLCPSRTLSFPRRSGAARDPVPAGHDSCPARRRSARLGCPPRSRGPEHWGPWDRREHA